jgi:hypothetical protein
VLFIFWYKTYKLTKNKLPYNIYDRYLRIIFQEAGKYVNDNRDGYTNRAFPFNKISGTKEQIQDFAGFLHHNLIATSFRDENSVTLVLSNGFFQYFPFLKPDFNKVTYFRIDSEQNLSVHISRKDYKKYKNELTFDQLCVSLGGIFMSLFRKFLNEEKEVILNSLICRIPDNGFNVIYKNGFKYE